MCFVLLFMGQAASVVCFKFSEPVQHKKTGYFWRVTQENEELEGHEDILSLCYKKCYVSTIHVKNL